MSEELATLDQKAVLDVSEDAPQNPSWLVDLISDRKRLVEQLTDYIVSPRQELLILHLQEDKRTRKSKADLQDVLRRIPMSMLEFFEIVKASRRGKSEFRTQQILDIYRPKVTKAVMEGALPVVSTCDKCLGEGIITIKKEEKECWKCKGTGLITRQPEHERQITALQVAGVLQKSGPGTVVNVNQAVDAGFRSSPEFRRDTDKLMYSATVVDVPAIAPLVFPQALPEALPAETILASPGASGERNLQPDTLHAPNTNGGSVGSSVVLVGKPLGKRRGGSSV